MIEAERSSARSPLRWSDPFKVRSVWVPPVVLMTVLTLLLTWSIWVGRQSDMTPAWPAGGVVNQDAGSDVGRQQVSFGEEIASI